MMIAAVINETEIAIDITAAAKILFPMKAVTPPLCRRSAIMGHI
jgi:hypothetical protein